jgi:hypothetical protein
VGARACSRASLPGCVGTRRSGELYVRCYDTEHVSYLLSCCFRCPESVLLLSRALQLLSSVLEHAGAVHARYHGLLSMNGSLPAQPLTLMVPGSCLNWQAGSRGLGSTQRTNVHGSCHLASHDLFLARPTWQWGPLEAKFIQRAHSAM